MAPSCYGFLNVSVMDPSFSVCTCMWIFSFMVCVLHWICPCSYGIYHCVAVVQPMVEEVIFPAEFHADRFDHPELRQPAKALPDV